MDGHPIGSSFHDKKYVPPNFKKKSVQLVFGQDKIPPIKHIANWIYIRQWKQEQIEKGVIRKNFTRINYDYNIGYKVIVIRNQAYKYETLFQFSYETFLTRTNGTVTIKLGAVTYRLNICRTKLYTSTEIE